MGALIAALASVLTTALNYWIQRHVASRTESATRREAAREFRIRQLNELYSPLLLLRQQSTYLWTRLSTGKTATTGRWSLVGDIAAVLADPVDASLAREILLINKRSEKLIIKHAGLIYGAQPPASFSAFLGHTRTLEIAMDQGAPPPDRTFEVFPAELLTDIEDAYHALKKEIAEALMLGPSTTRLNVQTRPAPGNRSKG